jgi:hypothetical protein
VNVDGEARYRREFGAHFDSKHLVYCLILIFFSGVLSPLKQVKPTRLNEDADVDIMTVEKVAAFSESDESEDGLYFLPTVPLRDASPPPPPPSLPASPNTASLPKIRGSVTPSESGGNSQDSDTEIDGQQTEQNSGGTFRDSQVRVVLNL